MNLKYGHCARAKTKSPVPETRQNTCPARQGTHGLQPQMNVSA